MLIYFTVGNYRSFGEPQTLSLAVKTSKNSRKNAVSTAIAPARRQPLLKTVAIYGANGSGKTNLLKAMRFFKTAILHSTNRPNLFVEEIVPFLLHTDYHNQPSFFEMSFICGEVEYQYGFSATANLVCQEWLRYIPRKKTITLFERKEDKITFNANHWQAAKQPYSLDAQSLFLSVAANSQQPIAQQLKEFFARYFITEIGHGNAFQSDQKLIEKLYFDTQYFDYTPQFHSFFRLFNLSIDALARARMVNGEIITDTPASTKANDAPQPSIPPSYPLLHRDNARDTSVLLSQHWQYNNSGKPTQPILFALDTHESDGTKQLLAYSGLLLQALQRGGVLLIDHLDAYLHPLIVRRIVELFHHLHLNPTHAQLIFSTHDISLMNRRLLLRRQVWFTQKDEKQQSLLYNLSARKGVRKSTSFSKNYMHGKYGGIPNLSPIADWAKKWSE